MIYLMLFFFGICLGAIIGGAIVSWAWKIEFEHTGRNK